jgi:hypothetical protein
VHVPFTSTAICPFLQKKLQQRFGVAQFAPEKHGGHLHEHCPLTITALPPFKQGRSQITTFIALVKSDRLILSRALLFTVLVSLRNVDIEVELLFVLWEDEMILSAFEMKSAIALCIVLDAFDSCVAFEVELLIAF